MKYENPSSIIWKGWKQTKKTKAKWVGKGADALGLKAFSEGTKVKLKKVM